MADYSVYEGVVAYAKQMLIGLAQSSKVAIFNDPNNQILTVKGKKTAIREVETKGAGDYTGQWGNGADAASVSQVEYYAPYDRAYSASVDSLKEAASYLEGAKPTLPGVATAYLKTKLAPEIDTAILARYAAQAGVQHNTSDQGYGVDADNILGTLTNIEAQVKNAGADGDVVVFLSNTVMAAFEAALLAKNILASDVVIEREMTREEVADGYGALKIQIKAKRFNSLLIVDVPDDRMVGKVYMLNGNDPGQQEGGVIPAKNLSSYFDTKIIAIPLEAAYANIRHIVNNLFVPVGLDTADYKENIEAINQKLFGVLTLEENGINQLGDGFKFNSRCVYGGDIFELYRGSAVVVKGTAGVVAIAPKKAEYVSGALSGAKTTSQDIKIACEDLNCSGTVYFDSATTASITVDASETLIVPESGTDMRPYCTPTITFGNTAGTSVISVYSDSNKTKKIGEFTATSLG